MLLQPLLLLTGLILKSTLDHVPTATHFVINANYASKAQASKSELPFTADLKSKKVSERGQKTLPKATQEMLD